MARPAWGASPVGAPAARGSRGDTTNSPLVQVEPWLVSALCSPGSFLRFLHPRTQRSLCARASCSSRCPLQPKQPGAAQPQPRGLGVPRGPQPKPGFPQGAAGCGPGGRVLRAPTLQCQVLLLLQRAQLAQDRAHQAMGRGKIWGKSPGTSALPPRRAGKPHSLFSWLVVKPKFRLSAGTRCSPSFAVTIPSPTGCHLSPWGFSFFFAELPPNREANRCSSPASAPAGPPL